MSRSICEALADDATDRTFGALLIIDAEPNAVVIAEIELRQITVKVLLRTVLVDALHAALEDAEHAFDRIGVDRNAVFVADVFTGRVADGFMTGGMGSYIAV